jgi:prefoldin subunit 5
MNDIRPVVSVRHTLTLAALVASTLVLASPVISFAEPDGGSNQTASQNTVADSRGADESNTTGKKTGFNKDEKPVTVTPRDNSINKSTAKAVNSIPGVNLNPKNLEPPPEEPSIQGFHPIKKLMAPIVRLERNSVQLQQQIMKLEGPIAGLNPPMVGLQKRMTTVQSKMGTMQDKLEGMSNNVTGVSNQMTGVREDIKGMRKQISQLQTPIEALRPPIEKLQGPLVNVAEPLTEVRAELAQMKALLATVLGAILVATLAISIGTPLAAIIIFRNRKKIFPKLLDQELVPDEKKDRPLARVS